MSKSPFFTIGIPVYNMEKWVAACLDSILCQDFADFELICVDDGSRDSSLEILNSYAAKDSRIKVIHKENSGVSLTRNAIHANARGEYIYAIDSDDVMCENVLSAVYDIIVKNNYPDIVQTGCIKNFNGNITTSSCVYPGDEYFDPSLTKDERAVKLWADAKFAPFGSTRFIRRKLISDNGIMFSSRYCALEDSDFSVELHRKMNSIVYTDIPSFVYMLRDTSVSTVFSLNYFKSMITRWVDFYQETEFWNLSDEYRSIVRKEEIKFLTHFREYTMIAYTEFADSKTALEAVGIIETLLGNKIKKLPVPNGKSGIIFRLYNIFGIRRVCTLLYRYLRLKGVIKE